MLPFDHSRKMTRMASHRILSALTLLLLISCSTVPDEYALPVQEADAQTSRVAGKTPVFFFNETNPVLFADGSWRIGIEIDGTGVANLDLKEYVRVDLAPKTYQLKLSHVDVMTFRNSYQLPVGSKPIYVKVFNGITSTKYEVMPGEPSGFSTKYKAAR